MTKRVQSLSNSSYSQGPTFHGVRFDIIDANGERWVTVKQLAEALGYDDHRALVNLINRRPGEFKENARVINLMMHENRRDVQRQVMVINAHGMIRVGMISDAPRAPEFRDCAEPILFKVMTTRMNSIMIALR